MGIDLNKPIMKPVETFNDLLIGMLRSEEGEVLHAYQDSLGFWTIGVGRLIDKRKGGGISPKESDYLLQNDIENIRLSLAVALPWYDDLDDARKAVIVSMAFQMGVAGLMGFKNTLAMIERGEYEAAADGMMNSLWAKQTPSRAKRHAEQMRTGEWHEY